MIENLENEQWLPIEDYEDLYQVSNYGRVKSVGNNKTRKEKILKSGTDNYGYQLVALCKDGKQKMFKVHRLVAMAFIDNPNNYGEVNHKDEVKTNNHVDNLEWCDRKYNCNYGTRNERRAKTMIEKLSGNNHPLYGKFGKEHPNSKQVIQLTLNGDCIKIWDSAMDVQRKLGYHQSNISACCRNKLKTSNGYKWCYV